MCWQKICVVGRLCLLQVIVDCMYVNTCRVESPVPLKVTNFEGLNPLGACSLTIHYLSHELVNPLVALCFSRPSYCAFHFVLIFRATLGYPQLFLVDQGSLNHSYDSCLIFQLCFGLRIGLLLKYILYVLRLSQEFALDSLLLFKLGPDKGGIYNLIYGGHYLFGIRCFCLIDGVQLIKGPWFSLFSDQLLFRLLSRYFACFDLAPMLQPAEDLRGGKRFCLFLGVRPANQTEEQRQHVHVYVFRPNGWGQKAFQLQQSLVVGLPNLSWADVLPLMEYADYVNLKALILKL